MPVREALLEAAAREDRVVAAVAYGAAGVVRVAAGLVRIVAPIWRALLRIARCGHAWAFSSPGCCTMG